MLLSFLQLKPQNYNYPKTISIFGFFVWQVFTCILQKLGPHHIENETQLPWKQVEEAVEHMMKACATYTNRDQAGSLWTVLLVSIILVECFASLRRGFKGTQSFRIEMSKTTLSSRPYFFVWRHCSSPLLSFLPWLLIASGTHLASGSAEGSKFYCISI